MAIELRSYQEKAIARLYDEYLSIYRHGHAIRRQKLIFEAPTGAGKTVCMAEFMNGFRKTMDFQRNVAIPPTAFIWIAPNQLHLQSLESFRAFFESRRTLNPIIFEDVTDGYLKDGDLLLLNWQSVNSENNVFIRENESGNTLFDYIESSKAMGIEIVVMLDEAHLFATRGQRAQELLRKIDARIEMDISATPEFNSTYHVKIRRWDVVYEQMIKKGVHLNPNLHAEEQDELKLSHYLLEQALSKQKELRHAYEKAGSSVKPLLLVQLPSANKNLSASDKAFREEVEQYLNAKHDITVHNERLAVWLADDKTPNLEHITRFDSHVDVLLFKQAISLGWDCPRAHILVSLRDLGDNSFTIQTVGRILRMPELRHYADDALNYGYVYTNLNKDVIQIVKDDADYITLNRSVRKPEYSVWAGKTMPLETEFVQTRTIRNRLGAKFYRALRKTAEEKYGLISSSDVESGEERVYSANRQKLEERFVSFDVSKLEILVYSDVDFIATGGTQVINTAQSGHIERFARTQAEIQREFDQFCISNCGDYAKVDSWPRISNALARLFEEYFSIDEIQMHKIVLAEKNQTVWQELLADARLTYRRIQEEDAAKKENKRAFNRWHVPEEQIFNDKYEKFDQALRAIMAPQFLYYRGDGEYGESGQEQAFIEYLEEERHKNHVAWWFKNGVGDMTNFSIPYVQKSGKHQNFYPDFIIQFVNGTLGIFDTKTLNSDIEFIQKHNASVAFAKGRSELGKPTIAGIMVRDRAGVFRYNTRVLEEKDRLTAENWQVFVPSNIEGERV